MISSPQSKMVSMMEIQFIHSLKKLGDARTPEDLDIIYYFLRGMESLTTFREPALRAICKNVRYEYHDSNDVLYCRGETASCWYILLSGSVFIDGSMYLPRNSFGKRIAGCSRRASECLILEPSEMIVIDYPENQFMKPGQRSSGSGMNFERLLSLENDDGRNNSKGRILSDAGNDGLPPELQPLQSFLQRTEQAMMRPATADHFHKRSSRASDTSSAYSGSDLMQSSLDDQDVDFTGLRESLVDSDDDDGEGSSTSSLIVRDTVRECLEKEPTERTEDDIEILLDFMQHFPAFANMTLATRRALCAVMVFAVVERADTVVMNDGEELDSWSVILNGRVEVEKPDGSIEHYHLGASFGITQATLEKQYHKGVMKTKVDDCQFVCIAQEDYYKILSEGEENTQRVEEGGHVVLVTEKRELDGGNRKGKIVIRGTPEKLTRHLVEEHSAVDPTYVDDFLLTYRTFLKSPMEIADKLIAWFNESNIRDRVTRVMLLWVNNHFNDFETVPQMGDFLERFEQLLERENLTGPLRLLNIACAAKARPRTVVLTRATREEILHFSVLGGMERGCGIFITKVERNSKAHESGLKRGDQILDVNNYSFERISHSRALEILRGTTHLAVTVKSNLRAFKEMLETPDSSPNSPSRSSKKDHGKTHADHKQRLLSDNSVPPVIQSPAKHSSASASKHKEEKKGGSLSTGHKTKIRRALMKFNFLPRTVNSDSQLNSMDDNLSNFSRSRKGSSSSNNSLTQHPQHLSASNPDLSTLDQYEDLRADFPEHVLKVYKADQMCKYLLVHRETTAREVVMLSLKEFGLTDPSSNYSLCEVTVEPEGLIKQKRLPDQMNSLPDRITLNGRYYLKNIMSTDTLVPDEMAGDLLREMLTSFLQLNSAEVAAQLMLRDFQLFRDIESTEYIDDLYELNSKFGSPHLAKFSELVNKEMFWVVTEVCSELNVVKRMKVIKQFIKIARHCKDCKNFNSMFAIVSGLGHGSVSRLKGTWDKLPSKYVKLFEDLQDLMDPSRNMSKYRNLVNSEMVQPPLIPFFPVVKKDLTFIHLGNDSKVESLINFEKLRMIAKEVRHTCNMASAQYDINSMYYSFGTSQSVFSAFLGSSVSAVATLRRKRRSATIPNPKKMFEEAQMVRRVRAYLDTMKITEDEGKLNELSLQCEAPAGGTRRRDPSPGPANLSNLGPKFGAESPEAVRKMLALSDKVRPHNPKYPTPSASSSLSQHHGATAPPSRSPASRRRPASPKQKRPPPPPVAVNLSPESSSVLSLSGINHRKSTATTSTCSNESNSPTNSVGSTTSATHPNICDTDSGHNSLASSNYDSHSTSSVGSTSSPPVQKRPQSTDVHHHPLSTYLPANHLSNHHHLVNQTNGHHSNHHCHNPPGPPPAYHPPPSRLSQSRPPLPPYHVVMQNNPAYSNYVQQQYQYLRSGRRPPVPPDYHVATQMVHAKRDKLPHYAKTHSYDGVSSCTYFPDMEDENEELVDDLADMDIGSMEDEEEVVSAV